MYSVSYTNRFKKDLRNCIKRGCDINLFEEVATILQNTGTLPAKYKPHKLVGDYKGCWECHITPDWLLIWKQNDKDLIMIFTNTGTHSYLFNK